MRVAIAQTRMRWTPDENTQAVVDALEEAQRLGAEVVVLPECATTGYHSRLPEQLGPELVAEALQRVRAACAALRVGAVVGTPFYPTQAADRVWNATVAIDAAGRLLAVAPKVGLTRSERRFFSAGTARPRFSLHGGECASILCREVRDAAEILDSLRGVEVVFWPGVIGWGAPPGDPEDAVTEAIAQDCARRLGSFLVQCNWPNSLNRPELEGCGGSLVLSPAGEVLARCPVGVAGTTLVELPFARTVAGAERSRLTRPVH